MTDLEKLKIIAFDTIRHEVRNFGRTTTDAEVGNYVRGVLDLYCEIMKDVQNQISVNSEKAVSK